MYAYNANYNAKSGMISSSDYDDYYSRSKNTNIQKSSDSRGSRGVYSSSSSYDIKSSGEYSNKRKNNINGSNGTKSEHYTGPKFYCQFCSNKKFKTEQYLEDHLRRRHMHLMEEFNKKQEQQKRRSNMETKLMETQAYFENLFHSYQMRNDFLSLQEQIRELQNSVREKNNSQIILDPNMLMKLSNLNNTVASNGAPAATGNNLFDSEMEKIRKQDNENYNNLKNELTELKQSLGIFKQDNKISNTYNQSSNAINRQGSPKKDKINIKINLQEGRYANMDSNNNYPEGNYGESGNFKGYNAPEVEDYKLREGKKLLDDNYTSDIYIKRPVEHNSYYLLEPRKDAYQCETNSNLAKDVRPTASNYDEEIKYNDEDKRKELLIKFYHDFHRRDQNTQSLKDCNKMLL